MNWFYKLLLKRHSNALCKLQPSLAPPCHPKVFSGFDLKEIPLSCVAPPCHPTQGVVIYTEGANLQLTTKDHISQFSDWIHFCNKITSTTETLTQQSTTFLAQWYTFTVIPGNVNMFSTMQYFINSYQ